MPLTLNQFLLLVITFFVVVAITFLISLFVQLRKTAKEGKETLNEIKLLASNLRETSQKVQTKIDDLDEVVDATRKTAVNLSEIAWFLTSKVIRPSSKYGPFLFPFLRMGWRKLRKSKEAKNVR